MERLLQRARECAEALQKQDEVLIVSHVDADGLASAGLVCRALDKINIGYHVQIVKQLDDTAFSVLSHADAIVFTDLGSGHLDLIESLGATCIVADHHQPRGGSETTFHLNPHLFGFNGATDLSGSGASYLMARALGNNEELSDLAIVGAVGDLQHIKEGGLRGINRLILQEAEKNRTVVAERDLQAFGRQTRPIHKLLEYASDVYIPGVTGNGEGTLSLLRTLNIPLKKDGAWRRWIDLNSEERRKIISALMQRCLSYGVAPRRVQRLIGEVYTLLGEAEGTPLRDASEFSTLLNATARYGFENVGVDVCLGDRAESYTKALELLSTHRDNLAKGINFVRQTGATRLPNLQYFIAGDNIRDTVVGIVAGMSKSVDGIDARLPIIGLANADDGVKASARGTRELVERNLNLAQAMNEAAISVGGTGGGHDIAAGATIPYGREEEFLVRLDKLIGEQLL